MVPTKAMTSALGFEPPTAALLVPLLCGCANNLACQPYAAQPPHLAIGTAAVFGLFSAAWPKSAISIGTLFAIGVGILEFMQNQSRGCGMSAFCGLLGNIVTLVAAVIAGAMYGFALENGSAAAKLGGGALAGLFGAVLGLNLAAHTCPP